MDKKVISDSKTVDAEKDEKKSGDPPTIKESAVHNKPSALIALTPFRKELDEFRDPTAEAAHVLSSRS